ncbi:MAG: adenosylcobinamide-phosphate synthase CbiB [Thermodesulfobacteriota bacterium]|nr:adenosylcobinamide-phosphate synthase CbiB [Thermodesulfobacteriota bacterium]
MLPAWYIPVIAFALDYLLADPPSWPHPVRFMGKAIDGLEPWFRQFSLPPVMAGILFAAILIIATWGLTAAIIAAVVQISPVLEMAVNMVLLYFCISARGLEKAAMAIYRHLEAGDTETARQHLALIVGRNVAALDEKGITRATVETVAENLVDGVISPLFFALIGGVPLAVAYKMVNTLDSMVGYKNERYHLFGRGAAKIDDVANYIPARVSVLLIAAAAALLFKRGGPAMLTGFREGHNHASPNAGYPEAAFAGALRTWFGGPNIYHGIRIEKPYIGKGLPDATPVHIRHACRLMMLTSAFAVIAACLFLLFC